MERFPIEGGAELLVLLKQPQPQFRADERGGPVPLVAVLRDTLGDQDPTNDRLRFVWSLTAARPTWWQRVASALPFFYWRVGGIHLSKRDPVPVLDLTQAHRPVFTTVGGALGQSLVLDSQSVFVRSSSRALRGNAADYRQAHVVRALAALADTEDEPAVRRSFSQSELQQMQGRLILTRLPLGGLVSDARLSEVYEHRRTEMELDRGHNWEMLRQRAEAEHLLFEPVFDGDGEARFALVSVDPKDLGPHRRFDGHFLNFADPWTDARLRSWKGFTLTADSPWRSAASPAVDRIPLGLYSLDYPRVPLLVVDFRDAHSPRRKELAQRTLSDVTSGVLHFTYISNWYFFAGRAAYDFVSGRHGAARNRIARAQAYEELRLLLIFDDTSDPGLKDEVRRRLVKNTLNPLDTGTRAELQNAQHQYAQLVNAAGDPHKLAARIARDRAVEMARLVHGPQACGWLRTAHYATFGLYTHREAATPALMARLEMHRRLTTHRQYLQRLLAANPELDVTANLDSVGSAVRALSEADGDPAVPALLAAVFERTRSEQLRSQCLDSLRRLHQSDAQQQLHRLAGAGSPAVGMPSAFPEE